jgi:hypothetical protein
VIGRRQVAANQIAEIAEGTPPDDGEDPAAVALGRRGGKARAEGMSVAKMTAKTSWEKIISG